VPALANEAKTASRLEQLRAFHSEVDGARTALPAFVYFSHVNQQSAKTVEKIIQAALRSRDSAQVSYAAVAIRKWMELPESGSSDELRRLASTVVAIIESGRSVELQQLIWLAGQLLDGQWLSDAERTVLAEVIPAIFEAADYINIDPNGPEAVSASTIRAACAKLAQGLLRQYPSDAALSELVGKSQSDPLPEVRFALNSVQ
jgi:hypothetical protein